ncbi:unnamed protein product [Ranitomeya imitator]|uniref:Helix-turn-helix domain-containing protein n=1 Tax=Ranitomeya imitator TaxID=111125 RepID=A0ABN9LE03_9NEOB|nr:unnamed protein product [Ranitomeya imitator]
MFHELAHEFKFIDDIFVIWHGTEIAFVEFVSELNGDTVIMKFTCEYDKINLPFLDVRIQRGKDGFLKTGIYQKPTSTNSLLRWDSHHPEALKRGIPEGQFLRLRRKSSDMDTFICQSTDMRFLNKGYPRGLVAKAYNHALSQNRSTLLHTHSRNPTDIPDITRIIGTVDCQNNRILGILNKHWDVLTRCKEAEKQEPNDFNIVNHTHRTPAVSQCGKQTARDRHRNLMDTYQEICHLKVTLASGIKVTSDGMCGYGKYFELEKAGGGKGLDMWLEREGRFDDHPEAPNISLLMHPMILFALAAAAWHWLLQDIVPVYQIKGISKLVKLCLPKVQCFCDSLTSPPSERQVKLYNIVVAIS